jgi:hypothetical protein
MDLDCPHLSLAPYWADEDDRGRIVVVEALDALRLCGDGAYEAVSASAALWGIEGESHNLSWEIQDFAMRIGLASLYSTRCRDEDLVELVGAGIERGDLVGLRKVRTSAATETEPTVEQRRLVAEIERETRGRLHYDGRQYRLCAGTDLKGTPERDSYEVVRQDEAKRVLDGLAKASGLRADLASALGKARDKLTPDWRPPLAPDGLVLLRKTHVPMAAMASQEPAITPSQLRAMMEMATLEIHVVDWDQTPQASLAFEIQLPDGGSASGKLDKEGRGRAKSSSPGAFTVTFPDLDGADWDGDGAQDLPEEERSETSRCKANAEDRVPAITRAHGFAHWRTVWDFPGNADLKSLRENPNVLWDGDEVAIPSKVVRVAELPGGSAEFVVNRSKERIVNVRLLDTELAPLAGIRYAAKIGDPEINRGIVPDDGFITLEVPAAADKVVVSCYFSDEEDDPPQP